MITEDKCKVKQDEAGEHHRVTSFRTVPHAALEYSPCLSPVLLSVASSFGDCKPQLKTWKLFFCAL